MPHHDEHGHAAHEHRDSGGPEGGRPRIDPEASELELVQHLARHLRRGSAVETAPWGLSPHQARALGVIARHDARHHGGRPGASSDAGGGLRLGALAGWLQIAPRSATEVVDALEELGLVARTPDPDDRRAVLVGLTERGRQVSHEIRAARRARSETLLEELSAPDRAQLRASLLTLLEAATR